MGRAHLEVPAGKTARLPRSARLKRRRLIRPLFDRGAADVASVADGTVRCVFRIVDRAQTGVPIQAGFVAARRVRRAVDRNRIKRVMRAAFQARLTELASRVAAERSLTLMFIFRADAVPDGPRLHRDVNRVLTRVMAQLSDHETPGGMEAAPGSDGNEQAGKPAGSPPHS